MPAIHHRETESIAAAERTDRGVVVHTVPREVDHGERAHPLLRTERAASEGVQ